MRKCQNCNVELSELSKFCCECGTPWLEKLICEYCGVESEKPDAKFCFECGKPFLSKEEVKEEPKVDSTAVEEAVVEKEEVPGSGLKLVESEILEGDLAKVEIPESPAISVEEEISAVVVEESEVVQESPAEEETEVESEVVDEEEDEFTFEEPESVSADGDDELNEAIMAMDGGEAEESNESEATTQDEAEESVDEEVTDEEDVVDTAGSVEETVVSEEENVPEEEVVETAVSAEETVTPEERKEVVAELVDTDIVEEYPSGDPLDKEKILAQNNPMSDDDGYENPLKTDKKEIDWLKVVFIIVVVGGFLTAVGVILSKLLSS